MYIYIRSLGSVGMYLYYAQFGSVGIKIIVALTVNNTWYELLNLVINNLLPNTKD
jgi:hypothetical protein